MAFGGNMSVAAVLQSLSIESAFLLLGGLALLAVVIGLHVRNIRWVQRLANSDASREAKARIEKLIDAVEKLSAGSPKPTATSHRPASKGRKRVPAARSMKPPATIRRAR
jgi:hypothetical protein